MEAMCSCSPDIVDILLKENVVHKLLKTLGEPSLGTPTKLLVLKVSFFKVYFLAYIIILYPFLCDMYHFR